MAVRRQPPEQALLLAHIRRLAASHLARRSPTQIEEAAHQALDGKGFDPELVKLICRKIFQRLSESEK